MPPVQEPRGTFIENQGPQTKAVGRFLHGEARHKPWAPGPVLFESIPENADVDRFDGQGPPTLVGEGSEERGVGVWRSLFSLAPGVLWSDGEKEWGAASLVASRPRGVAPGGIAEAEAASVKSRLPVAVGGCVIR